MYAMSDECIDFSEKHRASSAGSALLVGTFAVEVATLEIARRSIFLACFCVDDAVALFVKNERGAGEFEGGRLSAISYKVNA